jgi:hypothetical protein
MNRVIAHISAIPDAKQKRPFAPVLVFVQLPVGMGLRWWGPDEGPRD